MSITYKPKKKKRKKAHGFRSRRRFKGGKKVIAKRRIKKRWKISV